MGKKLGKNRLKDGKDGIKDKPTPQRWEGGNGGYAEATSGSHKQLRKDE